MHTHIHARIHNTWKANYKSITSDCLKSPYMSSFQLVVCFRTQEIWSKIIKVLGKTEHLPSIARDMENHPGRRATGGGLYCGMNHPRIDALSNPWMHTDIIRRHLEAEDTMVTGAVCWETDAFNCFNNFLGLKLPGLDLLSRKRKAVTEAATVTTVTWSKGTQWILKLFIIPAWLLNGKCHYTAPLATSLPHAELWGRHRSIHNALR